MQLSLIFWNNHSSSSFQQTLPESITRNVNLSIYETCNFDHVMALLERQPNIEMVLATLQPTDLQTFCHLQQLRQLHPSIAVLVIVDTVLRLPVVTNMLQRLVGRKITEMGEPIQERDDSIGGEAVPINEPILLTPRQLDVLSLLMSGKSNKEIARLLNLSEGTVKIHCMAVFKQLNVNNRTQAVIRAEQLLPQIRALQDRPNLELPIS